MEDINEILFGIEAYKKAVRIGNKRFIKKYAFYVEEFEKWHKEHKGSYSKWEGSQLIENNRIRKQNEKMQNFILRLCVLSGNY